MVLTMKDYMDQLHLGVAAQYLQWMKNIAIPVVNMLSYALENEYFQVKSLTLAFCRLSHGPHPNKEVQLNWLSW